MISSLNLAEQVAELNESTEFPSQDDVDWLKDIEASELLIQAGSYLAAIEVLSQAVKTAAKFEPCSLRLADTLIKLANVFECAYLRHCEVAEALYTRALEIKTSIYCAEDTAIAECLDSLARVVHGRISVGKREIHPKVMECLESVAYDLSVESIFQIVSEPPTHERAQEFQKRALKIRKAIYGPRHHSVAATLELLANASAWSECEKLLMEKIAIEEELQLVYAASSLERLAGIYCFKKQFTDAEDAASRALSIREVRKDDPSVALSLLALALIRRKQERIEEAEEFESRALVAANTNHPDAPVVLDKVAEYHQSFGDHSKLESTVQISLRTREDLLGMEHIDLVGNLAKLAEISGDGGEQLWRRVLTIQAKTIGTTHPNYSQTLKNLSAIYFEQSRWSEAEEFGKQSLAIDEISVGVIGVQLFLGILLLGYTCFKQKKFADAEVFYKRALALSEEGVLQDDPVGSAKFHSLNVSRASEYLNELYQDWKMS